jgi:hypothetical protein
MKEKLNRPGFDKRRTCRRQSTHCIGRQRSCDWNPTTKYIRWMSTAHQLLNDKESISSNRQHSMRAIEGRVAWGFASHMYASPQPHKTYTRVLTHQCSVVTQAVGQRAAQPGLTTQEAHHLHTAQVVEHVAHADREGIFRLLETCCLCMRTTASPTPHELNKSWFCVHLRPRANSPVNQPPAASCSPHALRTCLWSQRLPPVARRSSDLPIHMGTNRTPRAECPPTSSVIGLVSSS